MANITAIMAAAAQQPLSYSLSLDGVLSIYQSKKCFFLLITLFELRVNTSSRASLDVARYTSFSVRYAKAGLYLSAWQARR